MKPGMILTNNANTAELPTVNESKQLLPNALKLYKILEIHPGGMGAVCRNLHNGKIKSHQIENLRRLDIDEILSISSIDPNFSFKNQLSNSRIRNLHGKFPATLEDIDYDLESEGGEGERREEKTFRIVRFQHKSNASYVESTTTRQESEQLQ